jgi:putative MATE family efflux protein
MATPIAVGLLVQTLYYLVDLYFVSRLGEVALAGVGAAGNTMFLVLSLTQMLSVGTLATVSHAVGAGDRERANRVFNQAVMLAALLALGTLLAGYLGLADAYIGAIGADPATVEAGSTYLHWFMPTIALQFAMAAMGGALQGTGIVKPTMMVQVLSVLANVVLTPILVAGWLTGRPMGVAGAALATTLSAGFGVGLMAAYFLKLETYVRFDAAAMRPHRGTLARMLAVGVPAGGQFAHKFVYMAIVYAVIRDFGAPAQAGFGVGSRVMQAVFLPALAVAFAVPAIVGQNFGAREAARVRATFRTATWINVVFMLSLTLLCQWRPEALVGAFSDDPAVLGVATVFMTLISWNFVPTGINLTCSGAFQGMGNTLPALTSVSTRLLTFALPAFWMARQPWFRIEHVWYLSVATVLLQAFVSLALLRREYGLRLRFAAGLAPPSAAATSVR